MKVIKHFEDSLAQISLLDNGIVVIKFTTCFLEDVEAIRHQILSVRGHFGVELHVITDLRKIKRVSSDVRKFAATEEALSTVKMSALLLGNGVSRIAGNLYLKFSKPPIPTKLFNSFEKAQEWLLEGLTKVEQGK